MRVARSGRSDGLAQWATMNTAQDSVAPTLSDELRRQVVFNDSGLVPAIAQQHDTGEVLMMAWMDEAALAETLTTGWATYFSRSRQQRWRKGESSGHRQRVLEVSTDCDGDTLLLRVDQTGPACHTLTRSCFTGRPLTGADGAALTPETVAEGAARA